MSITVNFQELYVLCVLEVDLGPVSEAVVRIQMHPGVPEIPTEIGESSKWAMPPHYIGPILLGPRDSRTRIPTYRLTIPPPLYYIPPHPAHPFTWLPRHLVPKPALPHHSHHNTIIHTNRNTITPPNCQTTR